MPEVRIEIGGRGFDVACQTGEEHFLRSAAEMLDAEAQTLVGQMGRMPEGRMLLMAGLMLADRTAALEDQLREMRARAEAAEAARAQPGPLPGSEPAETAVREVAVIPPEVGEMLAELAARAEALAAAAEERAA